MAIDMKELSEMSVDQLNELVGEKEHSLLKARFDHSTKGVENPMEIRATRRDIARVKTELRSRELTPEVAEKRDRIRKRRRSGR